MMILGEHRECAELSCVIIVSASVLEKTKGHALFFPSSLHKSDKYVIMGVDSAVCSSV